MKITLLKSTFYFNGPISLTPTVKEAVIDVSTLADDTVRILSVGVKTGVIGITGDTEEYEQRVAKLQKGKKPVVKEDTPVVEEVEVVTLPVDEELPEVEETLVEEVKKKAPVKKTTTTTKKA